VTVQDTPTALGPDRTSDTPLYLQIAQSLYQSIATGDLRPGATIGSEAELTKRFGVSRVTLRQAIGLLVDQGLVLRRHGKGTYVQAAPVDFPLEAVVGTTQVFSSQGRRWSSRVASLHLVKAPAEVARFLQIQNGDRITAIWRVDYAGDQAVAAANIRLPSHAAKGLTIEDLERKPLYPLLEERSGLYADVAHQTIRAARATAKIGALIGVEADAPILIVARVTHASDGRPFEYSEVYFRAEAVRFSISLRAAGSPAQYATHFREHLAVPKASEGVGL
jgi:GntR family transcriptional regulator